MCYKRWPGRQEKIETEDFKFVYLQTVERNVIEEVERRGGRVKGKDTAFTDITGTDYV